MITVIGMLENGWESNMEHLVWRQLKGAWRFNLVLVPIDHPTLEEALAANEGERVFLIPPGRTPSIDLRDYRPPEGDVVYVFGRPGENLVRYVRDDDAVVSIATPGATDMMAISVVGIVLNECR